ncbi:hypothetical protein AMJ86_03480 [bacterium SM23_57]|nr:MAG: hypothetical protein AMJ86_03480 [bacterium SM23_57]
MPRWLLGGIFGAITGALDLATAIRKDLSPGYVVILVVIRIIIGMAIGSPSYYRISRQLRWVRGAAISIVLSIPVAVLIPHLWMHVIGFAIAYGAIIGYLIDRFRPLSSEFGKK